jgi:hypothetical protein
MNMLKSLAFGSALLVAGFTATAPAQADSVGVYIHSGGFGVQVSDYGYGRGRYYNPCNDFYYRQNHRYCWNDDRYAYNNGYGYGYRPHDERHDDWRFHDNRRHERWERRGDRREDWREDHRGRGHWDGDLGRWNGGEHHHH